MRVLSKADLGFFPKRWEDREVPVPVGIGELRESHTASPDCPFVFPSPTGNRETNMLYTAIYRGARRSRSDEVRSEDVPVHVLPRACLRRGFDVRTVQHWMGHKSLETTMRYLAPATDVHDRLDLIRVPGGTPNTVPKKPLARAARRNASKQLEGDMTAS